MIVIFFYNYDVYFSYDIGDVSFMLVVVFGFMFYVIIRDGVIYL